MSLLWDIIISLISGVYAGIIVTRYYEFMHYKNTILNSISELSTPLGYAILQIVFKNDGFPERIERPLVISCAPDIFERMGHSQAAAQAHNLSARIYGDLAGLERVVGNRRVDPTLLDEEGIKKSASGAIETLRGYTDDWYSMAAGIKPNYLSIITSPFLLKTVRSLKQKFF